MDLRQLEYVVAVAEERSFTKAAGRCHVVQSALSAQVARLERELSLRLFDRTSRSVRLTPAGELLLPHARALLRVADLARLELAAFAGVMIGRLRLGMIGGGSSQSQLVQEALVTFHERHPAIEVTVQDTGSRHMADQIRAGELDVALVGLSADQVPPGVEHQLLEDEPMVALVGRGHPLADRTDVTLAELATHGPFIDMPGASGMRLQIDEAFARAGVERTVAFELSTADAIMSFVALGLGTTLLTRSVAKTRADVAVLTLAEPGVRHPISLIHPRPDQLTPSARAFLALLQDRTPADRSLARALPASA